MSTTHRITIKRRKNNHYSWITFDGMPLCGAGVSEWFNIPDTCRKFDLCISYTVDTNPQAYECWVLKRQYPNGVIGPMLVYMSRHNLWAWAEIPDHLTRLVAAIAGQERTNWLRIWVEY